MKGPDKEKWIEADMGTVLHFSICLVAEPISPEVARHCLWNVCCLERILEIIMLDGGIRKSGDFEEEVFCTYIIQESSMVIKGRVYHSWITMSFFCYWASYSFCVCNYRGRIFSHQGHAVLWWIGFSSSDFMAWLHVVHYLYGATDRLRLRPGDHTSAVTAVKLRGYADCGYRCHGNGHDAPGCVILSQGSRLRLIFLAGKENWVHL
jgi:hypothetical protein